MPPENPEFLPVHNLLDRTAEELPVTEFPIRLIAGQELAGASPLDITREGYIFKFWYVKDDKPENMDITQIDGFSVVYGDEDSGEYINQPLILFSYLLPGKNKYEIRRGRPLGIFYGVHPNHIQYEEKPDFYLVTEDAKYADKPREERIRSFPLWRIKGVMGDPEQLQEEFMPAL